MDPSTKFLASRATRKMSHRHEAPRDSEVKRQDNAFLHLSLFFIFCFSLTNTLGKCGRLC